MGKYLLKRLVMCVVTLFALMTITFFLMHLIPGSPFAGELSKLPAVVKETLKNVLHGDFGTSLNRKGQLVTTIIAKGFPTTMKVGFCGFCVAMILGIIMGTVGAFSKNKIVQAIINFFSTIGVSVPSFLLALLMMFVFGVWLGWFPIVGLKGPTSYILPALGLAMGPIAYVTRLVRSSLQEEMRQDYMILARSKGTSNKMVIIRHALKNAMIPVITYAGPLLAMLLTGSFVIETMFSIPGIGAEFVTSVSNRDYTMIMALTIMYGAMIIVANVITDLITATVDPRIRLK